MHSLIIKQNLPIDLQTAWDFFSSPENLKEITPEKMGFLIRSKVPEKMYPGLIIAYIVKPLLGIPMKWVTEITHVKEGSYFVDYQLSGPYSIWHHQHHFREIDGGVEMTDILNYKIPLGIIGVLLQKLFIGNEVRKIFDYRYKVLKEKFGTL